MELLDLLRTALGLDQVQEGEDEGWSVLEKGLDEGVVDSRSWSSGRKVLFEESLREKNPRERNEEGVLGRMTFEVLLDSSLSQVRGGRWTRQHLNVRVRVGK
jgi:hypothetical protein